MALSSRPAFSAACNVLRRCGRPAQPAGQQLGQQLSPSLQRQLSSSAARSSTQDAVETAADQTERPRWSYTPERMKGPGFSINIVKNPTRTIWSNNNDPAKLDAMYNRLLGSNGDRVLPDETKWLAVTHKSFDQGRRGFNTRLAYFGRLILSLETTRHIMVTPGSHQDAPTGDRLGREHFQHKALANVDKLNTRQPQDVASKDKLAKLAIDVGLAEVIRWKPRMPENLEGSGLTAVLNTSLLAIIGAISLQHGAETAQQVVRDKILGRLGA